MPKCDFNKSNFIEITLWPECSPVNFSIFSEHLWMAASEFN